MCDATNRIDICCDDRLLPRSVLRLGLPSTIVCWTQWLYEYNYKLDDWEAERNGIPITESIDEASVRRLRDRLGGLTASGWALSLPQAYEALQEPAAVFTIVTDEFDPAIGDRKRKTTRVRFAKAIEEVYFGQLEGSPDVFTMDYSDFRNLKRPVTTRRAN